MTFDQQWEAARYNTWYWVSYAFMLLVPVVGAATITYRFRSRAVRRSLVALLAMACLAITAGGTMLSIRQKWDARYLAAQAPADKRAVANRDGANLVFAPIIGLACGGFAVVLTLATAQYVGRMVPARDPGE